MIAYLIICFLSAIFLVAMYYGKRAELRGGKQFVRIGNSSIDEKLHYTYVKQVQFVKGLNKEYISQKLHLFAEKIEQGALIFLEKLINKFGRAKDMVSGKDLPKNRGAVSFFLKHIESHKKHLKIAPVDIDVSSEDVEKEIDKVALRVKMDQVSEIFEAKNEAKNTISSQNN